MLFYVFEPGTDRQVRLVEFLLVHIDVELLLQGIGKRGNAMVQGDRAYGEHGIVEDRELACGRFRRERAGRLSIRAEPVDCAEQCPPDFLRVKLLDVEGQWIPVNQIPCVALQFAMHIVDKSGRTE